jgi:voltage-gated potassium channel
MIGDNAVSHALFSVALVSMCLVALYTIQTHELAGERDALLAEKRRRSFLGWILASIAIVERLASIFMPSSLNAVTGPFVWIVFVAFITWSELRAVLRQKEVTAETISMSISVYLLIGFTWGLVYVFVYQLHPDAFNLSGTNRPPSGLPSDKTSIYTALIYFSFTTLTTMGYGDVLPTTLQARYLAIAEGIMGIFYMAILVSRLVAMQMSGAVTAAKDQPLAPSVDNGGRLE